MNISMNPFLGTIVLLLYFAAPVMAQTIPDTTIARTLYRESLDLIDREKYRPATANLWKATDLLEKAGVRESALYANVLHQRGVIFIKTIRPDSAIILNKAAMAIREKLFGYNSEPVSRSLLNIGQAYYAKLDVKKVIEYSRMALAVARQLPPGQEELTASALNNISNAYVNLNDLPAALLYADSALQIRLAATPVDSVNLALSYNNMGNLQILAGNHVKAVRYLTTALDMRRSLFGKWRREVAATYCNLGAAVFFTGDNIQALELLETALEIRQKVLPPDDFEMAESFSNLMLPLIPMGDYDGAIGYGQQAIAICKKYGIRGMAITGNAQLNWGSALIYKEEYDAAIEHFEEAFGIFNMSRKPLQTAEVLNNLAAAYGLKRDFVQQKKYMRQVLDQKLTYQKDHPDLAITYINLGLAYQNAGSVDSALVLFDLAEKQLLRTAGAQSPHFITLHNARAFARARLGYFDEALEELEQAKRANRYKQTGDFEAAAHFDNLLTTLSEAGGIWRQRTDTLRHPEYLEMARKTLLEACDGVKFLQSAPYEPGSKTAVNTRVVPLYEALIATDMALVRKNKQPFYREEAFQFSESSRSFSLYMAIRNSDPVQFSGVPPAMLQQERTAQINIARLEKQLFAAEVQPKRKESLIDSLLNQLSTAKDHFRSLQQSLKKKHPGYFELKYQFPVETVGSVRSLLSPGQAMLEYFVGDSNLYIFVISADTFVVQEVKLDFPLQAWIGQLREGLYGYHTAAKEKQTDALYEQSLLDYIESATKLYAKLIAPVGKWLPEHVMIVPDGPLGYLPFDALLTDAPKDINNFKTYSYLLRRYQFCYTYSATLLRQMRDHRGQQTPEQPFLAFAPFSSRDTSTGTSINVRKGFSPLPYSGKEVAQARQKMGGDIFLGINATKSRFLEMAGRYRIIHLATHGVADNRMGDYTYLVFGELADSNETGLLYLKDLYSIQLGAELVVLSACETGVGKLQRGEGILSLARAFAYAGARSTITSLWSISNNATSEIMTGFYTALKAGHSKEASLREARVQYIETSSVKNSHPFYWAAFIPAGDMRPLR